MRSIVEEALTKASSEPDLVRTENEELDQILKELKTEITVIGCGGSGSNTITRMKEEGIHGAYLIAMNTDAQHLHGHRRTIAYSSGGSEPADLVQVRFPRSERRPPSRTNRTSTDCLRE